MDAAVLFILISFCDHSPLIDDFYECKNEITQCYYDDNFTMEFCIEEYKEDIKELKKPS